MQAVIQTPSLFVAQYLVYTTDGLTFHSDFWRINRSGERTRKDRPSGWINPI